MTLQLFVIRPRKFSKPSTKTVHFRTAVQFYPSTLDLISLDRILKDRPLLFELPSFLSSRTVRFHTPPRWYILPSSFDQDSVRSSTDPSFLGPFTQDLGRPF